MERVLRGEEVSEIDLPELYDLSRPILYFPIRHHSPACAWHLKKAVAAYEPDCILIEGPENAQEQIRVLAHPETKAPVALYYFYKDSKGLLSEDKEDYRCYYPFLDSSPELVAMREAEALGIPARFIDLPYGEILIGTAEDRGIRAEREKPSYNDDYLLSRSAYLRRLCEKTGLRSFDELWEKYFEIGGLFLETADFIRLVSVQCGLSRQHTPKEELEADGCLLRERYMAQQIAEASGKYKRILVVTGGFHTYGLMELETLQPAAKPVKLHRLADRDQGVYPIAYSMEAADALNGYASGMQSPGFYQQVWDRLLKKETPEGAYEGAALHQLVSAGRQARKKKEPLSSYDIICALSMAKGLAALRGKQEPGLYELRDAALSSFVKGEYSPSTDLPLRILSELNTGKQVGSLCRDADRPPLILDFEEQCRKFGLKIQAAGQQEVTLELFTKKKHLAMSRFFYQIEYLGTGFARRTRGADLLNRKDKSRIREIWSYRFSGSVLAALVDVSMMGGTVAEASRTRLVRQFQTSQSSQEAARLMAQGFLMGFLEEQARMGMHIREVLMEDGDFFSLTKGFSHLRMLYELQELYEVQDSAELEELIRICFQKIVQLLPSMAQVKDEQLKECMEGCLSLYQITGRPGFVRYRPVLLEAFERLLGQRGITPGLEGTVRGLLYGYESRYEARIRSAAAGYLQGTDEMQMKSAAFLRGLFYTARDFVFVQEHFLEMIDGLLEKLSGEAFMKLLPELRQAFGYFTPLEIDRIAGKAAGLHGVKKQEVLHGRMVLPAEYEYGEALDAWAVKKTGMEREEA
ncbi:MAG: hypothetical protein HFI15_00520 [Lachnospiraceae bacterium]|nr:hypothetical protein [Lachnospiraceae bacterium]